MKSLTKLVLCVGVLALVFVPSALAGTTCPTGNYSQYAPPSGFPLSPNPFTCATNALTFSQFSFQPGGSQPPAASGSSIGVTPITTPLNEGFMFNPAFSVAGPNTTDAVIDFEVACTNGSACLADLSLFFNGAFSGDGSTSFSETYCTTSFTVGCQTFEVTNPPPDMSKTINIPATSQLFITKDIAANGGTVAGGGSASVSAVSNQFSQVPEPASMGLLGTALLGAYGLLRRKLKEV